MILEVAILNIIPSKSDSFVTEFRKAEKIISSMKGYISHELQHCLENEFEYILLVKWETLEDHTVVFRQSEQYKAWKQLLHHFYEPFPVVNHYKLVSDEMYLSDYQDDIIDEEMKRIWGDSPSEWDKQ
jgi:heme-degrading monooxygenase HmoA